MDDFESACERASDKVAQGTEILAKIAGIIGGLVGLVVGFQAAGIGGAIAGLLVGAVISFIAVGIIGTLASAAVQGLPAILFFVGIALAILIIVSLWGIGRP